MRGPIAVAVFGAGGHGKVVADVARSAGYDVVAFVDDAPARDGASIWGLPIMSFARAIERRGEWPTLLVALGIGDNAARERCHSRVEAAGLEVVSPVHHRAAVAPSARVAPGAVVMAGAVVNPDAVVGRGCIVNSGAVVEHDCVLAAYVHLSPNAALGGGVKIGERTHLGLGAVALPGIQIGRDVRVGAGAVVNRDVADELTVVGVPARPVAGRNRT